MFVTSYSEASHPPSDPNPTLLWSGFGLEYGSSNSQLSGRWFHVETATFPGPHRQIVGGYQQIAEKVGEGAKIEYGQVVEKVAIREDGKVPFLTAPPISPSIRSPSPLTPV